MILADKIIQLRKQHGWSQEELADRMDVSRQSVSKWESAVSIPDMDRIIKLSKIFGVSTDYLLMDDMENVEYANYEEGSVIPKINLEYAREYLEVSKKSLKKIAFGVMLCIAAPIALIGLLGAYELDASIMSEQLAIALGLVTLFSFVFGAVLIFINESMKLKKYEFMDKEVFDLEYGVRGVVEKMKVDADEDFRRYLIISIGMIFVAVMQLVVGGIFESEKTLLFQVCLLLAMVAIAVFNLVYYGCVAESYTRILQEEDYSIKKKSNRKRNEAIDSIYWCSVVAIYLGWSFVTFEWHRTWIIWPVAGVLYGAIEAIMNRE